MVGGQLSRALSLLFNGVADAAQCASLARSVSNRVDPGRVVDGPAACLDARNLARIRERAGRLRSQQLTINLAHQMCHELRNGLWAFTLEGKNLGNHFDRLDRFFTHFEPALRAALSRQGLDAGKQDRVLQFAFDQWADLQADPQIDLKPSNEMAKDSERQIRSFANYLNLTIEELDRYLLGLQEENVPELLRVSDVWHEVRQLIELRLRSAGVQIVGPNQVSSDWVFVDRRSLVHTLINLTKNAIEALRNSTPPRQLTITIDASDSQVMCRCIILARLFEG